MERNSRSIVKEAICNYQKFFSDAIQSTVEWAEKNMAVNYSKVNVSSSPSNHKETQLCKLIDDNQKKVRWCYVVEKILDHYCFDEEKIRFINLHFFKNKGEIATCLDIGISRRTFYYWENEILDIGILWAKKIKLLGETA